MHNPLLDFTNIKKYNQKEKFTNLYTKDWSHK